MTIEQLLNTNLEQLEAMTVDELAEFMLPVLAYEPKPVVVGSKFEGTKTKSETTKRMNKTLSAAKKLQQVESELEELGLD